MLHGVAARSRVAVLRSYVRVTAWAGAPVRVARAAVEWMQPGDASDAKAQTSGFTRGTNAWAKRHRHRTEPPAPSACDTLRLRAPRRRAGSETAGAAPRVARQRSVTVRLSRVSALAHALAPLLGCGDEYTTTAAGAVVNEAAPIHSDSLHTSTAPYAVHASFDSATNYLQ